MIKTVSQHKAYITACRETLFSREGFSISPLETVRTFTREVDAVLCDVFEATISGPAPREKVCLIALGGYGRQELCPFSDIDILILHEEGRSTEAISAAVRHFWDIGLNMGCVVRTIQSCSLIMGDDFATDTALLENRFLTGDRRLYDKLQNTVITPHFEKKKKFLIEEIGRTLREGLYSPEKSIYRVEPSLKDGTCCLRDCHRLLWAEHVRSGVQSFQDLHRKARFTASQAARLEKDYAFLLGLRIALHMVCQRRMDVLETSLQPMVAELCGFGADGAGRMMEQFFKTVRRIRSVLLSFLERDLSGRNIWRDVRKRLSAHTVGPGVAVMDGIMFSTKSDDPRIGAPIWLMDVFKQMLVHRATLSVELRNRLRHFISHTGKKEFKTRAIGDACREILMSPEPVGRAVLMMHETRLLERLIPQFHQLTCKVEYDSYHEYTIDQHILQTIQTADDMAFDPDDKIRRLYRGLKRPFLLRLALLLHDIGKSQEGDHAQSGAIMAENVCERLGLSEEESGRVRFLVQHHLDMSYLSLQREPEDHNIRRFAQTLGNRENLDTLYLLTICDIRSVGRHTWTQWKAFQLEHLYERTRTALAESETQSLRNHQDITPAESFELNILEDSYLQGTTQEERLKHRQWLDAVAITDVLLHCEPFPGFERLTVCGHDRMGFLSDMIGCLSSEGYNILSARVYSTTDGKVLDIFNLEPPMKPRLAHAVRIQNLYKKWRRLSGSEITADELVMERIRKYPPDAIRLTSPQPSVQVLVDNSASPLYTVLEIDTPDNFGLLHKIARCFSENRINIASARLSTRIDQAVDVFYINDVKKRKIMGKSQIERLKKSLIITLTDPDDGKGLYGESP